MKEMGALAAAVLASLSQAVCAQAGDAVDRLKACSQFEGMERLKCVDELLGEIAEPPDSRAVSRPELGHQRDDLAGGLSAADCGSDDGARVVAGQPLLPCHPLSRPSHRADYFHNGVLETGPEWRREGRIPDQRRAGCRTALESCGNGSKSCVSGRCRSLPALNAGWRPDPR